MKKSPIFGLCSLALSFCLLGSASADQTVFVPLGLGTGLTQSGSFSDNFSTAGSFVDDYIYANAPSFSLDSYAAHATAGVSFQSVTLSVYWGDPVDLNSSVSSSNITASPKAILGGAIYMLEIKGTAAAGGSYTGTINSLATDPPAPVPEPSSWALMLAGLALTCAQLRRKN